MTYQLLNIHPNDKSARLDMLTGLRFIAAIGVVMAHLSQFFPKMPFLKILFSMGPLGVSFFFVLSGFVLTWSVSNKWGKAVFYRNRVARIYPLHIFMLLCAGTFIFYKGESIDLALAITSLLLVQAWVPTYEYFYGINGPSWSISCEAFFYLIFPWIVKPILCLKTKQIVTLTVFLYLFSSFAVIFGHLFLPGDTTGIFLYTNPLFRSWEFILGIVVARLMLMDYEYKLRVRLVIMTIIFVSGMLIVLNLLIQQRWGVFSLFPGDTIPAEGASIILTPLFALLIASVAAKELRGEKSFLSSNVMVMLGMWSFALYISHLVVIEVLKGVLPPPDSDSSNILQMFCILIACIGISGLLFLAIEKPFEALIRTRKIGQPLYWKPNKS